jgi:hypothetical protein
MRATTLLGTAQMVRATSASPRVAYTADVAIRVDPIELRGDQRGRRIAAMIRVNPRIIEQARETLERWIERDAGDPDPALLEWRDALAMLEPEQLARFFESETPRARRMRISSPFVGLEPRS